MAKKIGERDIIGERGIAHIRSIVLSMGWMFYETGGVEAGIDGFIELRDEATGIVGNQILQIQGKATEQYRLQGENDEKFEFPCNESDIAYWLQGTAPVLLIVVRLNENRVYWKSIKEWFSNSERLKSRKVIFDKAKDAFTKDSKPAVMQVASATTKGSINPILKKREDVLINLLNIEYSPTLFWAPTEYANDKTFGIALRSIDKHAKSEWIVREKSILSFHRLDSWPWKELCEFSAMEEFNTEEWAGSDDEDRRRNFVAILNRSIGEFVRPTLHHDKDNDTYYFPRTSNSAGPIRYSHQSLKSFVSRDVVKGYGKQKENPRLPAYWRHSAFIHQFIRLAQKWYLQVTPTYHFTRDGRKPDAWASEHLKKIKEYENNAAVLGQFLMWQYFLTTHAVGDLYAPGYKFLRFSKLEPFSHEFGISDELWIAQESNPSSPLFDWAQLEA